MKKVFRIMFFLVSAVVFLFFFFPRRGIAKEGKETEKGLQKGKHTRRKKVYYSKGGEEDVLEM